MLNTRANKDRTSQISHHPPGASQTDPAPPRNSQPRTNRRLPTQIDKIRRKPRTLFTRVFGPMTSQKVLNRVELRQLRLNLVRTFPAAANHVWSERGKGVVADSLQILCVMNWKRDQIGCITVGARAVEYEAIEWKVRS